MLCLLLLFSVVFLCFIATQIKPLVSFAATLVLWCRASPAWSMHPLPWINLHLFIDKYTYFICSVSFSHLLFDGNPQVKCLKFCICRCKQMHLHASKKEQDTMQAPPGPSPSWQCSETLLQPLRNCFGRASWLLSPAQVGYHVWATNQH